MQRHFFLAFFFGAGMLASIASSPPQDAEQILLDNESFEVAAGSFFLQEFELFAAATVSYGLDPIPWTPS